MITQQQINDYYEKSLKDNRIGAWGNTIILGVGFIIWCFWIKDIFILMIGLICLLLLIWVLGVGFLIKLNKKLKEYNEFKNLEEGEIPLEDIDNLNTKMKGENGENKRD